MALKARLFDIKDCDVEIGDRRLSLFVRPGKIEFMAYRQESEGYYKVSLLRGARMKMVGGSTQREKMLLSEINIGYEDYHYIITATDPRLAFERMLKTVKAFLEEFGSGFYPNSSTTDADEIRMFAVRNDIRRVDDLMLCARRE